MAPVVVGKISVIPRVIHFIFFGFTEFQYIHYLAVKSALQVHRVPVRLYYSQAPTDNSWWDEIAQEVELVQVKPPQEFAGVELTSYQYKADILRLQILQEQGGAYLDIDVISLKSFDDLWHESCVLGLENQDGTSITNAVILVEPGHPFISRWLEETGHNLKDRPWAWHGVCLPYEIYSSQGWPDIRLEPRSSFMPFDFRETGIFDSSPDYLDSLESSYTMHMWETIWRDQVSSVTPEYLDKSISNLATLCKPYQSRIIMPTSSERGKTWIQQQCRRIADRMPVRQVLDIGAGAGTYHTHFHGLFSKANWTAIEVWAPYIERYQLDHKYGKIYAQDAREVDYATLPARQDIVFAGDVLEHMTKAQAQSLVDSVLSTHRCMFISIPVVHMPQDEFEGNPYERHVKDDWTDQEVRDTFGKLIVAGTVDQEIGVYLLSRDAEFCQEFTRLRIAVYTICKNESKNVEAWADSNTEADYRLVCDTGSDDGTDKLLQAQGITVIPISVIPWRFDVARGTSLNLLPPDIDVCIWQDLDERLLPGWRQEIEKVWEPGTTVANHRYRNNGRPWQWHSKVHARHGCTWTGAVHETLRWEVPEHVIWMPEFYLDEHQDLGKNRRSYINLLEQKIQEGDRHWRTYQFYSNELAAQNRLGDCIDQRKKSYEACDEGDMVKGYVARSIAQAYASAMDQTAAERWFQIAANHSDERETYYAWSQHYYDRRDWERCYFLARRGLEITTRRDGFTYDPAAWGSVLYDMAAQSAYQMKLYPQALEMGRQALEQSPDDERLQHNLTYYQEACPVPLPEVLSIETSSNCNRTCGTCIRNSNPDRESMAPWFEDNFLPMDTIRRIFDDARAMGFRKDLCLSFYNEPTMDPRLPEIVTLATQYPFRAIFMHSNGDFMTEELAQHLDGKMTWIFFSIYADEPARTHRIEQIKSWFHKTEARFGNSLHGLTHYGPIADITGVLSNTQDITCGEPLDRFIINHRGEMTLCCDDITGNYNLGRVQDTCLYDLWFGVQHQQIMHQLQRRGGRRGLAFCENCPRPYKTDFKVKNIQL